MIQVFIQKVTEPRQKAEITSRVLLALPDWFGLPDSTREYIEQSKKLPCWAAFQDGEAVGFVCMETTSSHTAEVHCVGVLPHLHHKGIGRLLLHALEAHARQEGYRILQVKTVNEGHYPEYDRTVAFYEGMGFLRLEVFPTLWDPWNPCLVLVKVL